MRPPHSFSCRSAAVPTPGFSCPVMGSYYRPVTHSAAPPFPPRYPSATHPGPSPALVLPCPAPSLPTPWTLAPAAKISHPRSGAQAKKAANSCSCVYMGQYSLRCQVDPHRRSGLGARSRGQGGARVVNANI